MIKRLFKYYDIPITISLILLPILTLTALPIYIYYNGIVWQEPVMFAVNWFLAGLGITVGYHRLFAHKTFKAKVFFEWIAMVCGSTALQNTVVRWCSDHRVHHSKLDTKEDPYSITKGFFHAHIGWVLKKGNRDLKNVADLEKKSAIKFQNKFYWPMALFLSFGVPVILGFLYGRPIGGLLWGGVLRVTMVHHFTFFINSLCHFFGKNNYDLSTSAKDSWFMAFLTFGEGYHNYHHKFQWDYRNGVKWYNFDPSKWIIKSLSFFKITYSLKEAPGYSIFRAKLDTLNEKIEKLSKNITASDRLKIKAITDNAISNLELWKSIELKYEKFKNSGIRGEQLKTCKRKIKVCKLQAKEYLNSLRLMHQL